ncbi:hypothetical protein Glove_350g79 [Diversispora epigaea]|uniref:TLDc domain-containing protein n=1 Tax=Diversispora epigaea TaxID=1348612 RepID=A0A397HCY8_9GLOM|nr:hypothetical protein Glove_350g79 [Diversispora epigaea]
MHPTIIFEAENFQSLPEDKLISILKRDDLQLEESKIWEYVIQWGKAKNQTLPTNLDEWTYDNFLTLKEALKQCLPYIRYFDLSHEDVLVLPPQISSWIDRKEKSTPYNENNPYEFKLLIRGSRDGFDVKNFYNICHKVSNTFIVLKVEGTEEILGGYNPIGWDKNRNQWRKTQDSFAFSLKTSNMKIQF